jgi:hypothetical protein
MFECLATRQNARTLPTSIRWSNGGRANRQTRQRFLDCLKPRGSAPTVEYGVSVLGGRTLLAPFCRRLPRLGVMAVATTRKQPVDLNSALATELPLINLVSKNYCPSPVGIS